MQAKLRQIRSDSRDTEDFMRNQRFHLIAVFLAAGALFLWSKVPAQDRPARGKPFVQVPDTVSAEARQYLESLPDPATQPAWPATHDVAGDKGLGMPAAIVLWSPRADITFISMAATRTRCMRKACRRESSQDEPG